MSEGNHGKSILVRVIDRESTVKGMLIGKSEVNKIVSYVKLHTSCSTFTDNIRQKAEIFFSATMTE